MMETTFLYLSDPVVIIGGTFLTPPILNVPVVSQVKIIDEDLTTDYVHFSELEQLDYSVKFTVKEK